MEIIIVQMIHKSERERNISEKLSTGTDMLNECLKVKFQKLKMDKLSFPRRYLMVIKECHLKRLETTQQNKASQTPLLP